MKTILRFLIAGSVGFIVDLSILNLMLKLGSGSVSGRIVSFSIAVLFTFFINKNFTFQNNGNIIKQFYKYIIGSLFGFSINWIFYVAGLNFLSPQVSLIIASAVAMVVNFILYKFIVFKN